MCDASCSGCARQAPLERRPLSSQRALLTAGLALAALALLAGMSALAWFAANRAGGRSPDVPRVTRFAIPLDAGQRVNLAADLPSLAVSADGSRIAWVGGEAPDTRTFARALNGLEVRAVRGTERAYPPFLSLSPDGQWAVFPIDAALYRVSIDGGDTTFYRSEDGRKLYGVSFFIAPTLTLGPPEPVLDNLSMPPFDVMSAASYDISPNGRRFVMVEHPDARAGKSIIVVQNWFEELKEKMGSRERSVAGARWPVVRGDGMTLPGRGPPAAPARRRRRATGD